MRPAVGGAVHAHLVAALQGGDALRTGAGRGANVQGAARVLQHDDGGTGDGFLFFLNLGGFLGCGFLDLGGFLGCGFLNLGGFLGHGLLILGGFLGHGLLVLGGFLSCGLLDLGGFLGCGFLDLGGFLGCGLLDLGGFLGCGLLGRRLGFRFCFGDFRHDRLNRFFFGSRFGGRCILLHFGGCFGRLRLGDFRLLRFGGLRRFALGGFGRFDHGRLGGSRLDRRQAERLGREERRQRAAGYAQHKRQHDCACQNLSQCLLHDDILLAVHIRD